MLSDEEINARCAAALPILGPTRTGWLKEALEVEVGRESAETLVWACRAREVLAEMVALVQALGWAMKCVPMGYVCPHCFARPTLCRADCPYQVARHLLERYQD